MDTILPILRGIFVFLEVLLIFNLLIIVHELGHFLAARWRGLIVDRFGIWFGKPIWKKKINGVTYSLGSIPAGGFVSIPQMAPMESVEGKTEIPREELPSAPWWDKTIVALAGPVFSFGLAFVFAVLVWVIGRPTTESETTTTIGYVEEGSPGARAGLRPGDTVLEVDGQPVNRFVGMGSSISWRVIRSEGKTIPFKIKRDGEVKTLEAEWVKQKKSSRWGRESLRQVRISPQMIPLVGEVEKGGLADQAGLKPADVVEMLNGQKIYNPFILDELIEKHPEAPVLLAVRRGTEHLELTMTPGPVEKGKPPRTGILWDPGKIVLTHPGPIEQIAGSVDTMFNMLGALFSPKSDVKAQHFSGPVGIMNLYYKMFQSDQGWRLAIWFSVFFNVNLAILNLLPIPVLDGGHILLAIIEGIRRRPVNQRILEFVQTACALLIIGYMLYVTFFDVQDVWPFKRSQATEESSGD